MSRNLNYPLGEHQANSLRSAGNHSLDEVSLTNLMAGKLNAEDLRIHADTLRAQAEIARQAGYSLLADNLSRAAELTHVPDAFLLAMYETLRPGRSTSAQLSKLAMQLENEFDAPLCAAFVRQAETCYQLRGLLRDD